jgi:DNA-binding beta-propeller fold protein YncE
MKKLLTQIVLLTLFATINLYAQTSGYHLIKKTVIGGEGGWDYLFADSQSRRLYVSHGNQVEVLDMDSHHTIGVIPNTKGVHGICTAPKLGRGFITNGKANTVTIFDLKNLKSLQEIPAGINPDALLYDEFSERVFIFNNDSKDITVIEAASGTVIKTFSVGGNPEAGVADDKGTIFVNVEDTDEVVSFDSKTLVVKSHWKLAPGVEPNGLVLDNETHRIFSACRKSQTMIMLDSDNGKIIGQLPIGKGVDGVIFDPAAKLVITSNGEGTLTVIHEDSPSKFSVVETVRTEPGARTMTFDSKTQHVFLSAAQYGPAPAATPENPHPWPSVVPGTFMILEYGRK